MAAYQRIQSLAVHLRRRAARLQHPGSFRRKAANEPAIRRYISEIWRLGLGRPPEPEELVRSTLAFRQGKDPMQFLQETLASPEAMARRTAIEAVRVRFPPGHYYSPIVNPAELLEGSFKTRRATDEVSEIELNYDRMAALFIAATQGWNRLFPQQPVNDRRYYADNDMYNIGDAVMLSAMLRHFRPAQWIEVGCGFSSAILLDTLDDDPTLNTALTFIEPHTERLELLLRATDRKRVSIIRSMVQEVPLDVFDRLGAGDVLFLDTTHISKTGSDVNHEIFRILPRLASGVIIHFHDVFDQFEYPDEWIFDENRSWNELYMLRAFLMYNREFEVLYANAAFARHRAAVVEAHCPEILHNPGGGLWLRKQ